MSCCDIVNGSFNKLSVNYPCSGNTPSNWSNYAGKSIISASSKFIIGDHKSNISAVRSAYNQLQKLKKNNPDIANLNNADLSKKIAQGLLTGDSSVTKYVASYGAYEASMNIALDNVNKGLGFKLTVDDIVNCDPNKGVTNPVTIMYNNIKVYVSNNKSMVILFLFIIILVIIVVYIYKKRLNTKISNINIVNR